MDYRLSPGVCDYGGRSYGGILLLWRYPIRGAVKISADSSLGPLAIPVDASTWLIAIFEYPKIKAASKAALIMAELGVGLFFSIQGDAKGQYDRNSYRLMG